MDNQTTIGQLKKIMHDFVSERDWQKFHNPKNLAMSISIEAAELMEHFQWLNDNQIKDELTNTQTKAQVADELADIINYCLSFANATNIDISDAVLKKNQTQSRPISHRRRSPRQINAYTLSTYKKSSAFYTMRSFYHLISCGCVGGWPTRLRRPCRLTSIPVRPVLLCRRSSRSRGPSLFR